MSPAGSEVDELLAKGRRQLWILRTLAMEVFVPVQLRFTNWGPLALHSRPGRKLFLRILLSCGYLATHGGSTLLPGLLHTNSRAQSPS